MPVGRLRRPKPLERSARPAGRCPSNDMFGARRPRSPGASHAALGTGARSPLRPVPPDRGREKPRAATPGRVPGNGVDSTSPSPTEAAESAVRPRPNGCPRTSTASPTPTETGTSSTTAALERVPDCCRHVAPAAETVEVPRQLRSDGCPTAVGASPLTAETAGRSTTTTPGLGARLPPPRRLRGRNRGGLATAALERCPSADGTSLHPAETGRRSVSPTLGRVPVCRRCLAFCGRNR